MQERALHLFGGGEETLAGAGQPRPGGAAVEQFGAERRLQRRDAAAGGGVIETQPLGPGDELTGAGDGEEDANVVPIHATTIAQFCTREARKRRLLCEKPKRITLTNGAAAPKRTGRTQ